MPSADQLAAVISLLPDCVEPLDLERATRFDIFCWRVVELRSSRLIAHGEANRSVGWEEDGLRFLSLSPEESMEAFESLCVRFRRLNLDSEEATFLRVRNELSHLVNEKHGPGHDEVRDWLRGLKATHKRLEQEWAFWDLSVSGEPLMPKRAFGLVFNGEMFHADPERAEDFSSIGNWRLAVAAEMYQQIALLSDLYLALAQGIGAILARQDLLPAGFDPYLKVVLAGPGTTAVPRPALP